MSCKCKNRRSRTSNRRNRRKDLTPRQHEAYDLLKGICGEYDYEELGDLLGTTPQAVGRLLRGLSDKRNISCNTVYDSQGNDWQYYKPKRLS